MAPLRGRQLADLFEASGDALVLYARAWLDREGARDVVQDAFVRLAGQKDPPENLKAWLYRSVRNAAMNEIRSRLTRRRHEPAIAQERGQWFEQRFDELIDAASAQQALEQLGEKQREVVVMRIWGQLTLAEIGQVLGESVSTVHSRYVASLEAIRQRMTNHARARSENPKRAPGTGIGDRLSSPGELRHRGG